MNAVEGWHRVDFGSLLALVRNGYSGQQVGRITEFPVSRIETISGGVVDLAKVGFVDSIPDSYFLNVGDILFSNINSLKHIGKVAQVKAGTCLFHGMNLLVFRAVDDVDAQFLFYKLTSAKPWFEKMATQAINQASINQTTIKELVLDIPTSKAEQTKIAEVLSTVDRAIEQTEALIAKQQRIKTGLMQDLLTRGIDSHGNLRSEQTHKFKDSPLGRIPVEWDYESLGSRLKTIEQGWSPDCNSLSAAQGQWGVLKTTSVVWEGFQSKENKVLPASLRPKPQYEVRRGDVLMTRGGPNSRVGVVAFVYDTQPQLMLSDKLYRLVLDDTVDPEFIVLALSSAETQRHLSTLKTGLAESQTNISQEIVRQLCVALPPKPEQQGISQVVRNARKQSQSDRENLEKLRSLKTALMQDLLTGKVPVTPLLIEPEEAST